MTEFEKSVITLLGRICALLSTLVVILIVAVIPVVFPEIYNVRWQLLLLGIIFGPLLLVCGILMWSAMRGPRP